MAYQSNKKSEMRKSQGKHPASSIQYPASRKGFTLLEVLVAIAVFGLIVAAAAGTFTSIQQAWRRQRNTLDIVQNARWAMERMANEIRHSTVNGPGFWRVQPVGGGGWERLRLGIDTDGNGSPDTRVWYWRGNNGFFGPDTIIYRGTGVSIVTANSFRQELANFIVDNPTNDIFIESEGLLTIELTVRPRPAQAEGPENRDYTLRTQVRVRN